MTRSIPVPALSPEDSDALVAAGITETRPGHWRDPLTCEEVLTSAALRRARDHRPGHDDGGGAAGAEWTERYVSYARAHGCSPEAMVVIDRERYPGGANGGFVVWNSQRLRAWRSLTKRPAESHLSPADHAEYDAWLAERVSPQPEAPRGSSMHERPQQLDLFAAGGSR